MAEREISADMVTNTIAQGVKYVGKEPGTTTYTLAGAGPGARNMFVVTNSASNKIITVIDMNNGNFAKAIKSLKPWP